MARQRVIIEPYIDGETLVGDGSIGNPIRSIASGSSGMRLIASGTTTVLPAGNTTLATNLVRLANETILITGWVNTNTADIGFVGSSQQNAFISDDIVYWARRTAVANTFDAIATSFYDLASRSLFWKVWGL